MRNELVELVLQGSWRIVPPALAVALILAVLRRPSPRAAHTLWAGLLAGMLLMPLLVAAGPRWQIALPEIPWPVAALFNTPNVPDVLNVLEKAASVPRAADPGLPSPEVKPASGLPRLPWRAIYGAGLAVMLARFLRGLWLVHRLRRGSQALRHPRLQLLAREWVPGRGVVFCSSPAVRVPFTIGWMKPQVFLPPDWETWKGEALCGIVSHELAHVRRHDYAWSVLAELNRCLYWFHPLAWFLARRLSQLAERASDELAASAMRSPTGYARVLIEIAGRMTDSAGRIASAAPVLSIVRTSGLAERVEALLAPPSHRGRPLSRRAGTAVVLALAGVLLLSAVFEAGAGTDAAGTGAEARAAAAFELARRSGDEEGSILRLVRLLGDDEPIAAAPRWRDLGKPWAPARAVWHHPSTGEVAAIGLASFGSRSAGPLVAALASADPVVRRNAAWSLGEIRHPRNIPEAGLDALVRALRDPDPEVRAAAAWAVGDIRIGEAVPELIRILRQDPSSRARAEAAYALGELGEPD